MQAIIKLQPRPRETLCHGIGEQELAQLALKHRRGNTGEHYHRKQRQHDPFHHLPASP